jgi:hypothetical protein
MLNQWIAIILSNPSQLTHNLIGEEIDSFFGLMQFFGLFGQHEVESQSFVLC